MQEHIISLTVEDRFGMLARIAGLFSARGYNINSLVVATTEDPSVSRLVLTVSGDQPIIEQIIKQLNKLIGVIKTVDLNEGKYLERELLLVKVDNNTQKRSEILKLVELYRGMVIDVTSKYLMVEAMGESHQIDGLLVALRPYGLKEVVRTGKVAIGRE
ncbi:MAG: acetolactate synthase small subunit [Candidatus Omnitrophota bacterium]|jgi:acetolactate synthase-1/3 small subunit|nr:acetolactate synthase small subunit [Candidatus Omnitrophota bacterium]